MEIRVYREDEPFPELDSHPTCASIPLMADEEVESLAESIKLYGVLCPIPLREGKIAGGRHRLNACRLIFEQTGKNLLKTLELGPTEDAAAELACFADDVHRRHLSESQRAVLAAEWIELAEKNELQICNGQGGKRNERLARLFNVSARSTHSGLQVWSCGTPDLRRAVKDGWLAVSTAERAIKAFEKKHQIGEAFAGAINAAVIAGHQAAKNCEKTAQKRGAFAKAFRAMVPQSLTTKNKEIKTEQKAGRKTLSVHLGDEPLRVMELSRLRVDTIDEFMKSVCLCGTAYMSAAGRSGASGAMRSQLEAALQSAWRHLSGKLAERESATGSCQSADKNVGTRS